MSFLNQNESVRVALDSNVLIPLEDTGKRLDADLARMILLSSGQNIQLCVHPQQEEDIEQDKNKERKEILLSRMKQYQRIPNPPTLTEEEKKKYDWREIKRNDCIDNLLLAAVVRRAVKYLITEDRGIHRKARRAGIGEYVLTIPQFLVYLDWQREDEPPIPMGIKLKYAHEFDVSDAFFDSLRDGYADFNSWWRDTCCAKNRQLWGVEQYGRPLAICVFKVEESEVITIENPPLVGKHLKICTFKVGGEIRGRRIGERLLHTAFQYATHHRIPWIYLHADVQKHQQLLSLCLDYGFERHGTYGGDVVLIKPMIPQSDTDELDALAYAVKYHPNFIEDSRVRKFMIPVRPQYHERLFPDISSEVTSSTPFFEELRTLPGCAGNTIKKAYICHSSTNQIREGDLVLFYRSKDRCSIEVVGVVELARKVETLDDLTNLVSKRTVYSVHELSKMIEKRCLVILFRTMKTFPEITKESMKHWGIAYPQQITEIIEDKYVSLADGGLNEA